MGKIRMLQQENIPTIAGCFKEFLDYCKLKNLSSATTKNYIQQWGYFVNWLDSSVITDITQDNANAYIRYMQGRINNPESINTSLRNIRVVLNYFNSQNLIPPITIKLLKVEQKVKDCYTDAELSVLLKKPDIKRCSFTEFRTWTVINFLIGTGCRIRSLTNIKICDLDLDNGIVALTTTKNRKAQILPLTNSLVQVLKLYLKHRQGRADDYLFPSVENTKLLETSVSHDIADYNRVRGVNKTSVHLFRHTYCKNYVLSGGDVFRLQKLLGHSSITMSQRYCNLYDADLKEGLDAFNLLERLNNSNQRIKIR